MTSDPLAGPYSGDSWLAVLVVCGSPKLPVTVSTRSKAVDRPKTYVFFMHTPYVIKISGAAGTLYFSRRPESKVGSITRALLFEVSIKCYHMKGIRDGNQ
jgi:hypothetical protein